MNDDHHQISTQGMASPIIVIPGSRWHTGLMILALSLSLVSLYIVATRTSETEREARLAEHYDIDLEVFLAKKGLNPPPDPWRQRKEETNAKSP
jgi:hypothetical protein